MPPPRRASAPAEAQVKRLLRDEFAAWVNRGQFERSDAARSQTRARRDKTLPRARLARYPSLFVTSRSRSQHFPSATDSATRHGDCRKFPRPASRRQFGRARLSQPAAQRRGRAGPARRDPGQQRRLRPRLRFPQAGALRRGDPPPHLRDRRLADPRRQGRDADHAQDLPRRARPRRRHRAAISRPPRRRRDDDHQRLRLRPHHPRPRGPPRADPDRRGRGQRRL